MVEDALVAATAPFAASAIETPSVVRVVLNAISSSTVGFLMLTSVTPSFVSPI